MSRSPHEARFGAPTSVRPAIVVVFVAILAGWLSIQGPAVSAASADPAPGLGGQSGPGGYGTVNLALHAPVAALSNTAGGSPLHATDGDHETVWWSFAGSPVTNSFVIDLGTSHRIGLITVIPGQTHSLTVSTSEDCVTYTQRYTSPWSGTSVSMVPIAVAADGAYAARCVRYTGQAAWAQYVGIYEIEVYEWLDTLPPPPAGTPDTENLALNRPVLNVVSAWSGDLATNPPSFAVDGSTDSVWLGNHIGRDDWSHKYNASGYSMIDLGAPTEIGRLVVAPAGVQSYWVRLSTEPIVLGTDIMPPAGATMVYQTRTDLLGTPATFSDVGVFDFYGTVTARYVYVSMVNHDLTLRHPGIADVEVYGWVEGAVDTTPPVLTLPPAIDVEATDAAGAEVSFPASAVDDIDGDVPVACTPASGSIFSVGATVVECRASDAAGNTSTGRFTITVTPPPAVGLRATLEGLLAHLLALQHETGGPGAVPALDAAIVHLTRALDPWWWNADGESLNPARGERVLQELKNTVNKLRVLLLTGGGIVPEADVRQGVATVLAVSRLLAAEAIEVAQVAGGTAQKLALARAELAKGDAQVDRGNPVPAVEQYRNAWKHAMAAMED